MEPTQRSHLMAHVVLPLTIPFLRVASLGQLALVSRSTAALVYPSLFYNLIPITAKDFDGEERDTPGYRLGRTLLAEGGWERAKHVLSVCIRSNSPPCPGPYQLEQYTNVGHFCADMAGRFPNLRRLKMDLGTYQWLSDPETLLCFSRLTSLEELEIEQVYGPEEEDWDAVQRSRELVLGFPKLRHLDVKGPFPFPIPVPSMPTLHHGMYVEEDGILDQFGGSYDALWEHQESHLREWAGSVGIALVGGMIELASEAPNLRRIFWQPWDPEFESFQWIEMRVVRGDTVTVEGGLMEPVYEMPGRKRVGDKVIVPFRT